MSVWVRRMAILVCAIAASTPRKRRECVYTGTIVVELGIYNETPREKEFVRAVVNLASDARDHAASSRWVDRRTQQTDAEAEAWLRCLGRKLK